MKLDVLIFNSCKQGLDRLEQTGVVGDLAERRLGCR